LVAWRGLQVVEHACPVQVEQLASGGPDLADDERTGSDTFSASKVAFADDGVWLTHNRVARRVLLTRR
jgi:hypothetical protein